MLSSLLMRLAIPRWLFGLAALLHMALLFWLSALPPSAVSKTVPGPLGNFMHVLMNMVLAAWLLRAFAPRGALLRPASWPGLGTRAGALVVTVVLLHGIFDETHQFYVGRTCSVLDVLLDVSGALLVLLFPLRAAPGRARRWWLPALVLGLACGLAVLGWAQRPWPDRLLERLLQ